MIGFTLSDCLSAEQEKKLAVLAAGGDRAARDKLILANIRFVVMCTKPFRGRGLSNTELEEEGVIGLINAVDHFDVTKGFRLTTYARFWIRRQIFKALNECGASIRLSDDKARMVIKLRKALPLGMAYACRVTGCKEAEARRLLALSGMPAELDALVSSENGEPYTMQIADTESQSIEDTLVAHDMQDRIRRAVLGLRANEREVVIRHFGLHGKKPESFGVIAQRTGVSRSRMQQVEQNAFRHLRETLGNVNLG